MEKLKLISIRVPSNLNDDLKKRAILAGTTQAEYLRELISDALNSSNKNEQLLKIEKQIEQKFLLLNKQLETNSEVILNEIEKSGASVDALLKKIQVVSKG